MKDKNIESMELENLDTILRGINFLSRFSLAELEKLISKLKKTFFKKGTIIIREGEEGEYFYFISNGKVGVWIKKGLGKKFLKNLGPGEYFGEMALLAGGKRNATIIAEEDTNLFMLLREDFRNMLFENPSLTKIIINTSDTRKAEIIREKGK